MGKFTSEVVNGQVILRRKVADAVEAETIAPAAAEPVDKGTEVVTEETTPDPKPADTEKPRRRPRADEVSDG